MEFTESDVAYALGLSGPEKPRSPYEVLAEMQRSGRELPKQGLVVASNLDILQPRQ